MKYLIIAIFTLTTSVCFAVDKKLSDIADEYSAAIKELRTLRSAIKIEQDSLEYWLKNLHEEQSKNFAFKSVDMIAFHQSHIDEAKKNIKNFDSRYYQTEELIKKLEPMKKEYDRQAQKEFEKQQVIDSSLRLGGHLLIFSIFILGAWVIIRYNIKYRRLLKEGKITQQQYDEMTSSSSSPFSNMGVNPSTGLPMCGVGISDASGTPRGGTPTSSYSSSYRSDDAHRSMLDR